MFLADGFFCYDDFPLEIAALSEVPNAKLDKIVQTPNQQLNQYIFNAPQFHDHDTVPSFQFQCKCDVLMLLILQDEVPIWLAASKAGLLQLSIS